MKPSKPKPGRRCEYCREPLKPARVCVYRRRGKLHVLFENVAALVCRVCGHRVFEPAAVEAMEHALNHPTSQKRAARLVVVSA